MSRRHAVATTTGELVAILQRLPPHTRLTAISPTDGQPWPVVRVEIGHEANLTGLTPKKPGRVTTANGKDITLP